MLCTDGLGAVVQGLANEAPVLDKRSRRPPKRLIGEAPGPQWSQDYKRCKPQDPPMWFQRSPSAATATAAAAADSDPDISDASYSISSILLSLSAPAGGRPECLSRAAMAPTDIEPCSSGACSSPRYLSANSSSFQHSHGWECSGETSEGVPPRGASQEGAARTDACDASAAEEQPSVSRQPRSRRQSSPRMGQPCMVGARQGFSSMTSSCVSLKMETDIGSSYRRSTQRRGVRGRAQLPRGFQDSGMPRWIPGREVSLRGTRLQGRRIRVLWPDDDSFYVGTVIATTDDEGMRDIVRVEYQDGAEEEVFLGDAEWALDTRHASDY